MYQIYPVREVHITPEFLAHEKGLITYSHTIAPAKDQPIGAAMPDEIGKVWIPRGSFIDKDGKVTEPTVTADDVTFAEPPIGILFSDVDVTYAPADGAIMIEGWVKGDYMCWGDYDWNVKYGQAIHKLLPGIKFKDFAGNVVYKHEPADED